MLDNIFGMTFSVFAIMYFSKFAMCDECMLCHACDNMPMPEQLGIASKFAFNHLMKALFGEQNF